MPARYVSDAEDATFARSHDVAPKIDDLREGYVYTLPNRLAVEAAWPNEEDDENPLPRGSCELHLLMIDKVLGVKDLDISEEAKALIDEYINNKPYDFDYAVLPDGVIVNAWLRPTEWTIADMRRDRDGRKTWFVKMLELYREGKYDAMRALLSIENDLSLRVSFRSWKDEIANMAREALGLPEDVAEGELPYRFFDDNKPSTEVTAMYVKLVEMAEGIAGERRITLSDEDYDDYDDE